MSTFNLVLNGLQVTSLMLIAGGTVVIGALIAPLLFKSFAKKDASKFMIKMFEQYDDWLKFSAGALLASKLIQVIFLEKFNFVVEKTVGEAVVKQMNMGLLITFLLCLLIAALSFHIIFRVTPNLKNLYDSNKDKQSKEFNELHKHSEMLHKINFLLALILLLSFV